MTKTVTPRQRELYVAIQRYMHQQQRPPTDRDLGTCLRCSHHTIQELRKQLEDKGYITHTKGAQRSLRILRPLPSDANPERRAA